MLIFVIINKVIYEPKPWRRIIVKNSYFSDIMMNKKETEKERFDRYKKILLGIIYKELTGCKVYLFGSRATKKHKPGSDIDLALDMGVAIDPKKIYIIEDKIEETTIPLHVDLVDLYTASGKFREEIEREGILWKS